MKKKYFPYTLAGVLIILIINKEYHEPSINTYSIIE